MNIIQAIDSFQGVHVQTLEPVLAVENLENMAAGGNDITSLICIGQIQNCILAHSQAGAGQEHHVLLQGRGAGMQVNLNIVGDRQHEGAGINGGAAQLQVHGSHNAVAIGVHLQHIGGRIVILNKIGTRGRLEHSVGTDELNGGAMALIGHKDGGSNILGSAVLIASGNLHILHIVLAQREHPIAGSQLGGDRTTTEVHDLEVLIDGCAILGSNGAVTIDIAPAEQVGAGVQINVRAGEHIDVAQLSSGATAIFTQLAAGGSMTAADFDVTVDSNVGVTGQGQGAIGRGRLPCDMTAAIKQGSPAGTFSIGTISGIGIIIRNQQRGTGRNGVAAGNGTIVEQDDGLVGAGSGSLTRFGQIVILGLTNTKQCDAAGNEDRSNFHIRGSNQLIAGVLRNIGAVSLLPAVELISGGGGCHQGQLGTSRNGHRGFCSNGGTIDRVVTVCTGLEGQVRIRGGRANQRDIGNGQGTGGIFGGFEGDGNRATISQCAFIATGTRCARGDGTSKIRIGYSALTLKFPVKLQSRFAANIIGQRQNNGGGIQYATRCSAGNGIAGCRVVTVFIVRIIVPGGGQTVNTGGQCGCGMDMHGLRNREQGKHQHEGQHKCQQTLR